MKLTLPLAFVLVACAAPAAPVAPSLPAATVDAAATPREAVASSPSADYPPTYPVLSEAELDRRTVEAQKRTPGWVIVLDPLGFLSTATCEACSPGGTLTPEDRAQLTTFLSQQTKLVFVDGPSVTKKYDNANGALYQQSGTGGPCGNVRVDKLRSKLMISGHLWPVVPSGELKPEATLERDLGALDATPDLVVKRGYRMTAASVRGPVEHREVACMYNAADDIRRNSGEKLPPRPCLDAHTGEDVTARMAGTSVSTSNGKVTLRTVTLAH
jgi:hypothetical protein